MLPKKTRLAIYEQVRKEVEDRLLNRRHMTGLCFLLQRQANLLGVRFHKYYRFRALLPEFWNLRPSRHPHGYWFGEPNGMTFTKGQAEWQRHEKNTNNRLVALDFAIAQCEDATD